MTIVLATFFGTTSPSGANGEDVCPELTGDAWGPCSYPLPTGQVCPLGTTSPLCTILGTASSGFAGLTRIALQLAAPPGSRSTFHLDATYLLAQAAGFTPRQAYVIAAYDQTADLTQYTHRDQTGALLPDPAMCEGSAPAPECGLMTAQLPGFDRDNFEGGGVFFHFMAPFAGSAGTPPAWPVVTQASMDIGKPPTGIDGFHPDFTDDRDETMVSNARRWALGRGPLCVAGLTEHAVTGHGSTDCYRSPTRAATTLNGRMPFSEPLGVVSDVNWTTKLGEMQISGRPGETQVPASAIGTIVGQDNAALARIGLYLHLLQDRISHHICNTSSYVLGPRPAGAPLVALNPVANDIYQLLVAKNPGAVQRQQVITDPDLMVFFDRAQCDQTTHSARHELENGHPQDEIPAEDRTTEPSLIETYRELRNFAASAAVEDLDPVPNPSSGADEAALVVRLVTSLDQPTSVLRLADFTAAALENCLLPLPGYGGYDYAAWSARADAPQVAPGCHRQGPSA